MRPTKWRTSTHLAVGAAVLATVAALVAAAALLTSNGHDSSAHLPPPPPAVTPKPGIVPVSANTPMPSSTGLAAALALVAADPNLGRLGARVTDALTGEELGQQSDDVPLQPASTNKTLTSAAALLALDRNARVTTRVVAADESGTVVLVGGGDPTLSSAAPGQDNCNRPRAPRLSDLADQVRRSATLTAVQVNTSLFSGPTFAPGWDPADIEGGDIAPIESVMLDEAGFSRPPTSHADR